MSSGMPLRDRPQDNADNSPHDWLSRPTTPLRIAKRDSPQPMQSAHLARRQSSSYKHLRNNNLVTKSPFRSQIPTSSKSSPAPILPTRRVSGEKRPRPHSMAEQAENEHPLGFKRRQSKTFQGLLVKEPVTKSPFKLPNISDVDLDDVPPPVPPKPFIRPVASASPLRPSPARPALVSKRLHGPRKVSNGSQNNRRQRRKTVTWDERCDVVEFDSDYPEDEDVFESQDEDGDAVGDDHQESEQESEQSEQPQQEESFDGSQVGNDSITGLVESMLHDAAPQTPPHNVQSLPADIETEDGVPYGRTHHADRLHATRHADTEDISSIVLPLSASSTSPMGEPHTPNDNHSPLDSSVPLGRSTHSERAQRQQHMDEELDEDVRMLPPSPSPAKTTSTMPGLRGNRDSLIPKFALDISPASRASGEDLFAPDIPRQAEASMNSLSDDCMDPANLSIGNSEVSLDGLNRDDEGITSRAVSPQRVRLSGDFLEGVAPAAESSPQPSSTSNGPGFRFTSPIHEAESSPSSSPQSHIMMPRALRPPSYVTERVEFPPVHLTDSPSVSSLKNSRSNYFGTKLQDSSRAQGDAVLVDVSTSTPPLTLSDNAKSRSPSTDVDLTTGHMNFPPMSRENHATHDGVLAVDPKPQAIDPPRPSLLTRANTDGADTFEALRLDFESDLVSSGNGTLANLMSEDNRSDVHLDDVSALDRLMENVAHGPFGRLRVEAVTEGVRAAQFAVPVGDDMTDTEMDDEDNEPLAARRRLNAHSRGQSEPILADSAPHRPASPSGPPPKDAIRARDELIKAKKREARRKEEQAALGYSTPSHVQMLQAGRPSRRRSMSTGDAEDLKTSTQRRGNVLKSKGSTGLLDVLALDQEDDDPLGDSINRELRKLDGTSKSKYHVRERGETIYASSDPDVVSVGSVGDIDNGKAWRKVKRPSDMNEYAKQIREMRAQDKSGKAYGKVFVRVLGVRGLNVPLPEQQTIFTCTLNNGIHYVTTPECRIAKECRIDQEFELIEHSKLEFTLTIKIRRDPHIIGQFKANAPPTPRPPPVQVAPPPASKGGGMRNFFRSSPKKPTKPIITVPAPIAPLPEPRMVENLARFLKPDGTLARAFISFRDIAHRCDTKLFETSYPLVGQRAETRTVTKTIQVGDILLQIFRLPPIPGIPPELLPQSLEECHRGLRHIGWHKVTYFEGTLTQNGGDCTSWRRRHLRLIGANLVAYNDVTKRVTATIDLKKAIAVEDNRDPRNALLSPASGSSTRTRHVDEFDGPYGSERSFRLIFSRDQEITFFADTDEEKARWLEVLRALVGRVPPNPLWAELVWERQQELARTGTTPLLHR